jgi:hypothetical protein
MNINQKEFPIEYSNEVKNIIYALSLTNGEYITVYGSNSLTRQLYASDYDCYETIELTKNIGYFVEKFQFKIKNLMNMPLVYIMNFTCGKIPEWQILDDKISIEDGKVINYNQDESKAKLKNLFDKHIITASEFHYINNKLKPTIEADELFSLKQDCSFHIIKWTPKEIIRGYTKLINGDKYTLKQGFLSKSIIKLDVIAWVNGNRFTDFSVIYQFTSRGQPINGIQLFLDTTLKEDILSFVNDKKYFKTAKRIFALSLITKDNSVINKLTDLFNGDLGRIYNVYGDILTLINLIENEDDIPYDKIEFEIGMFRQRLANVNMPSYLKEKTRIFDVIDQLKRIDRHSRPKMLKELRTMKKYLENLLNTETEKILKKIDILPLKKKYLP